MVLRLKVLLYLTNMENNSFQAGLYTNDFHRQNSMDALREVKRMSLHPYSRQQKLQQINLLHQSAVSKENCNMLRSKKNG